MGCGFLGFNSLTSSALQGNATSYDGKVGNGLRQFTTPSLNDALIKLWATDVGSQNVRLDWVELASCTGGYIIYKKVAEGWLAFGEVPDGLAIDSRTVPVEVAGTQSFAMTCLNEVDVVSNAADVEVAGNSSTEETTDDTPNQIAPSTPAPKSDSILVQSTLTSTQPVKVTVSWDLSNLSPSACSGDLALYRFSSGVVERKLATISVSSAVASYADTNFSAQDSKLTYTYFVSCGSVTSNNSSVTLPSLSTKPIEMTLRLDRSSGGVTIEWWAKADYACQGEALTLTETKQTRTGQSTSAVVATFSGETAGTYEGSLGAPIWMTITYAFRCSSTQAVLRSLSFNP